jgi:hypothetical protein
MIHRTNKQCRQQVRCCWDSTDVMKKEEASIIHSFIGADSHRNKNLIARVRKNYNK